MSKYMAIPKIINSGFFGDLRYFDMQYIQGYDFSSFALLNPVTWMHPFVSELSAIMTSFSESRLPANNEISHKFLSKIDGMEHAINSNPLSAARYDRLKLGFEYMRHFDFSSVPTTDCHGDFTLENIIFDETGRPTLIDLLDGDINSFWLDAAKLCFDLEISWSIRHHVWAGNISSDGKLLLLLSEFLKTEFLEVMKKIEPDLSDALRPLKIFQASRILPYAKDPVVVDRLVGYIENQIPTR